MCYVGIDVSKAYLDVAILDGEVWRVKNDPDGLAGLLGRLDALAPALVVIEPTGGYERPAVTCLGGAGLPVVLINPRQVRDFARAAGQLAKTDRLDAQILARYGQAVGPELRPLPTAEDRALAGLVARRRQLLAMRVAEVNRQQQATGDVADSLTRHLTWLNDEIAALGAAIVRTVGESPAWSERAALLQTVPGVGKVLAATLVAELPELGRVDRGDIAGLVGLAPYRVDSGKKRGHRRVGGGRCEVRTALYMPTLTATKRNPAIKAFYDRLRERGKCHKVAIVACMRKLLVMLNAIARSGRAWDATLVPGGAITP